MPISYSIDESGRFTVETWEGEPTYEEIKKHWQIITTDPESLAGIGSLADFRACRNFHITTNELTQLMATYIQPAIESRGRLWKIAVVISSQLQHGMVRQFAGFTTPTNEVQIFSDPVLAREWLLN